MVTETSSKSMSGVLWLALDVVLVLGAVPLYIIAGTQEVVWVFVAAIVLTLLAAGITVSFYMLQPNQAAVLKLFGAYRGSDRTPGLRIANPLYNAKKVSLRVRNFITTTSKVNDANGNPIEIAAVLCGASPTPHEPCSA